MLLCYFCVAGCVVRAIAQEQCAKKAIILLGVVTLCGKGISHVNEAMVNFNVSFFDVNMDIFHGTFISGKSSHTHHANYLQ